MWASAVENRDWLVVDPQVVGFHLHVFEDGIFQLGSRVGGSEVAGSGRGHGGDFVFGLLHDVGANLSCGKRGHLLQTFAFFLLEPLEGERFGLRAAGIGDGRDEPAGMRLWHEPGCAASPGFAVVADAVVPGLL